MKSMMNPLLYLVNYLSNKDNVIYFGFSKKFPYNVESMSSIGEDTEFIFKLGLINSRKRGTNQKKIGFNWEGNNGINKKVRRPR